MLGTAKPKPVKGAYWLERKAVKAERKNHERREMDAAKRRDFAACHGCRWPTCPHRTYKPRIHAAHVFEHRGMGGNPDGRRTERHLIMGICVWCHARLDAGDAEVQEQTPAMADGACAFFERNLETGRMEHVATEKSIGVSEARR